MNSCQAWRSTIQELFDKLPNGTRLLSRWGVLRTSYWFVPSVMLALSIGLAFLMLYLDTIVDPEGLRELAWFHQHETSGARDLLSTVAGSMITVAGVTFSITIVSLTLASSQFGPRLLRNFMRDPGNQVVLGTFIATYMYCLLILRSIRDAEDVFFIPYLSITVALVLTVANLGMLIFFIHHTATSIQISHLIAKVGASLEKSIDELYPDALFFPEGLGHEPPREEVRLPERFMDEAWAVRASKNGYLRSVDEQGLMAFASENDLLLYLKYRPGDFVIKGKPLVWVWSSGELKDERENELRNKFALGIYRTQEQDLQLLFEELVEVALRSLSTGIDDPLTTVMCLDHIAAALARLAERDIPSPYRSDEAGKLRVVSPTLTFPKVVRLALSPIRRHGEDDLMVSLHLLRVIEGVAEFVGRQEDREALLGEAVQVRRGAQRTFMEEADLEEVEQVYRQTVAALTPPG